MQSERDTAIKWSQEWQRLSAQCHEYACEQRERWLNGLEANLSRYHYYSMLSAAYAHDARVMLFLLI